MAMKRILLCFGLLLLFLLPGAVWAAEEAALPPATEIYTVEQLQAIAGDPSGSYILMADLDMTGIEWKSLDFSGIFDGNGHAILNLTLTQPGDETSITYDGNVKTYDTCFVGLFGTLQDAEVKNLRLINVRSVMDVDVPCFLGGLAGCSKDSVISDCTVTGCLELRAYDRMFGVGGVVGYGNGMVQRCIVDVTLICTDTDPRTLDEQFLGGVFATGFMDVLDCDITIDGYCSEYGYVHNGGITGMYMQYPIGGGREGKLTGNTITGKITFFECNSDRRAYCRAEAGEILASWYTVDNNTYDFLRDERWEYNVELRPEMCAEPVYTETLVYPGCDSFGYSRFRCQSCGYTYSDAYTLPRHTVTVWTVTREPTTEEEGLSTGSCDGCGLAFERTVEKLELTPTAAPEPTQPQTQPARQETEPAEATQPVSQDRQPPGNTAAMAVWLLAAAAAVIVAVFLLGKKGKAGKYLK